MLVDIIMPKMGESITEGTIIEWRKKIGDNVEKDEMFLEIGTDKVNSEIPASAAGILVEILAEPNDVVEVGKVIGRINTDTKAAKETPVQDQPEPIVPKETKASQIEKPVRKSTEKKLTGKRKSFFTPVVMKIAQEKNIPITELDTIHGTGRGSRVTKKDLLAYLDDRSEPVGSSKLSMSDNIEEMEYMRKKIADHMRSSLDTAAHVHVMTEVDMTTIVDYVTAREESFSNREGFSLTYTPFIVTAVVKAIQRFPLMNCSLDGVEIVHKKNINIGMAVSIEDGLMVPVIKKCEEANFLGLCRRVRDITVRTRDKKLSPDELQGSTFSISNFGVFNVTMGTPIINQPNVGILGVGAIKKRPVVIETEAGDTIGIRSMMILTLGFDHRLIDGAGGSQFIDTVRKELET
ncbi:MAG: 2-oxo acid dehydrogenase subunit E2, partial [Dehalococcoidia bacterium]|nr:2-oxo acid dehydrogenase subunit E2 [Dehalococcoidia bacterium]